ncbi:MAG: flagellar hook-length control protein FliK [Rickettsiaceae bacterium]|nr:flagellar hook-length control protein FliK [Rickettsiaceae bacterium]
MSVGNITELFGANNKMFSNSSQNNSTELFSSYLTVSNIVSSNAKSDIGSGIKPHDHKNNINLSNHQDKVSRNNQINQDHNIATQNHSNIDQKCANDNSVKNTENKSVHAKNMRQDPENSNTEFAGNKTSNLSNKIDTKITNLDPQKQTIEETVQDLDIDILIDADSLDVSNEISDNINTDNKVDFNVNITGSLGAISNQNGSLAQLIYDDETTDCDRGNISALHALSRHKDEENGLIYNKAYIQDITAGSIIAAETDNNLVNYSAAIDKNTTITQLDSQEFVVTEHNDQEEDTKDLQEISFNESGINPEILSNIDMQNNYHQTNKDLELGLSQSNLASIDISQVQNFNLKKEYEQLPSSSTDEAENTIVINSNNEDNIVNYRLNNMTNQSNLSKTNNQLSIDKESVNLAILPALISTKENYNNINDSLALKWQSEKQESINPDFAGKDTGFANVDKNQDFAENFNTNDDSQQFLKQELENLSLSEKYEQFTGVDAKNFTSNLTINDLSDHVSIKFTPLSTNTNAQIPLQDQISISIQKASNAGVNKIQVALHPESLGKVDIELNIENEIITSIKFIAHKQETLESIKADRILLEQIVKDIAKGSDASLTFLLGSYGQDRNQSFYHNSDTNLPKHNKYQAIVDAEPAQQDHIISDNKVNLTI